MSRDTVAENHSRFGDATESQTELPEASAEDIFEALPSWRQVGLMDDFIETLTPEQLRLAVFDKCLAEKPLFRKWLRDAFDGSIDLTDEAKRNLRAD